MSVRTLILFVLAAVLVLATISSQIKPADATPNTEEWWDTGWKYRIPITFTNTLDQALYNFQLNFTIDTQILISEGKMRSDCGDIRIVYNGEMLPYWIDTFTMNWRYTIIWFKIGYIPPHGSVTVYMYYGNPSATSMADGDEVFLFFDDFDGPTLDTEKWYEPEGTGTYKFDTDYIFGKEVTCLNLTETDRFLLKSKCTFSGNVGIVARVKRFTNDASDFDFYFAIFADYNNYWEGTPGDYSYYRHEIVNRYEGMFVYSSEGNRYIFKKWKLYSISRYQNNLFSVYPVDDPSYLETLSLTVTNIIDEGYLAIRSDCDEDRPHGIDWVAVRKYVSPLPNYTIGNEETFIYVTVKSASGNVFPGLTVEIYDGVSTSYSEVTNSSGCALLAAPLGTDTVKIKYGDHILEEKSISVSEAGESIEVTLDFDLIIISSAEVTRAKENPILYLCMAIPFILLGFNRRRSIQTWVAMVLAIVITIAIAVPIYVWVAHMTAPGEAFRPTRLAILDYSMLPNRIDLTLKNVGEYTDALHSITIKLGAETLRYYNSSTTVAVITPSGVTNVPLGNVKLKPGATYEIVIPFEWTAGYTYTIKILGKANSIVETELTP